MPITVNGELLPDELVAIEQRRLALHPDFRNVPDSPERSARLGQAAEDTAINRLLMAQAAARDPRPIDEQELEREWKAFQSQNGAAPAEHKAALRSQVEIRLRLKRTIDEIRKQAGPPTEELVRLTYERHRESLRAPERVHAAHIIKHTGEGLEDPEARMKIDEALAELERGVPFEEAADKYSDCAGAGGDIGWFARGKMVQEFEDAAFALEAGARSGVFRSALGYHIAKVIERRAAGPMEFEEARPQVEKTVAAWLEHEALRRETMRLRGSADIRRVEEASHAAAPAPISNAAAG